MLEQHIKIGEGGRVIIPAAYRKELDLHPGDELIMRLQNGEIRLFRQMRAVERIRALVKKKKVKNVNYVDDFIAFRKQESGD